MKIKFKSKKSGFSLTEIALAVLIVAVLAVLTVPIIGRQLEKSEEYAYYVAYKTVEKMAGQIVALGDPAENSAYKEETFKDYFIAKINKGADKFKSLMANLGNKFAYSETYLFTKLFPKTIAETITGTTVLYNWNSDDYDEIWRAYQVCNGKLIKKGEKEEETDEIDEATGEKKKIKKSLYYRPSDFGFCYGYTKKGRLATDVNLGSPIFKQIGRNIKATIVEDGKVKAFEKVGDFEGNVKKSGNDLIVVDPSEANVYELEDGPEVDSILKNKMCDQDNCKISNFDSGFTSLLNHLKTSATPNAQEACENYYSSIYGGKSISIGGTPYSLSVSYGGASSSSTSMPPDSSSGEPGEDSDEFESQDDEGNTIKYVSPCESESGLCYCSLKGAYSIEIGGQGGTPPQSQRPAFAEDWCTTEGGWFTTANPATGGIKNEASPTGVDCQCQAGYQQALNNDRTCYPKPPMGKNVYDSYIDGVHNAVYCAGDFSETDQNCCSAIKGEHSLYNGTSCVCATGWQEDASGKCNKPGPCPKGTSKADNGVCVTNPPIVGAKRFCELVAENWNINSSSCSLFTATNGANVYTAVFNAVKGNDTHNTYMSINSKPGAFKDLTPNIVFANGLKMWILGDKAASIPGLSFFTDDVETKPISDTQNMCIKVPLANPSYAACKTATPNAAGLSRGWFCRAENSCFKLTEGSYPTDSSNPGTALREARNCCGTADMSDLHAASADLGAGHENDYKQDPTVYAIGGFTVFVDINGSKGEGTLWHDVFPFYITANGTVYPGYPLNAPKEKSTAESVGNSLYLGGNSEKQLPVDVYYYLPTASNKARERKLAFSNVSYARGVCSARKVSKFTPYCLNLGKKFYAKGTDGNALPDNYIEIDDNTSKNPCDKYNCYVSVKRKLRYF